MEFFKLILFSNVYDDNSTNEGGIKCYKEMEFNFKFIITFFSLLFHFIYLIIFNKKINKNNNEYNKSFYIKFISKLFGLSGLIIWIIQCWFKFSTYKGIYMLNPCHVNLLISSLLLLRILKDDNKLFMNICLSNIFGLSGGLLFPDYTGLQGIEIMIFDLEHYFAIINLLILNVLQYNYYKSLNNISNYYYGYCFFLIYQRLILWPLSEITWVNINYTLCGNYSDFFYQSLKKYYYIAAELYVPIAMYLFRFLFWLFIIIIIYLVNKINKFTIKKKIN